MKFLRFLIRFIIGWFAIAIVSTGVSVVVSLTVKKDIDQLYILQWSLVLQAVLLGLVFIVHPAVSLLVKKDKHLSWIRHFWQPHMGWLWLLLFLTLLSSGVALAFPLVFRYVIDFLNQTLTSATPEMARTVTWRAATVFIVIGLARTIIQLYPGFRAMLNLKIGMDVREYYFSKIINKGYKFFQKIHIGDMVTRLTDDIEGFPKIAWFSCSGIFRAVESGSKFFFCVAFMIYMNWKLALLSISPLPIMLAMFYFIRLALTKAAADNQAAISKTNDALEAAFSGVRIVKAFRAEENQAAEFRKILNHRIGTELRLVKLWMGISNIYMWIQYAGQAIVMVVGGMMVIRGTVTPGELYAFYIYLSLLAQPLLDIPQLFVSSRQAFACIDREIEIDETPGGTEGIYDGTKEIKTIESIDLRNIKFKFEDNLPLSLDDVNITLRRGEKAAVVGSVGSGKTTLIKIFAGLIPPTEGSIVINGDPLTDFNINRFRGRIGYIPQESTLFSESVADNVSFGREIPESEIRTALDMAQVLAEMDHLPHGINEVLGQKGLTVSGGQKQRLAIARALAGKPDVLLMDDCTSALDAENERRFWEMFADRFPTTACLIVTHRLATARKADVIYVLDHGKIVGKGTHDELLKTCEEYRSFLTREELAVALQSA